ncbi:hypothetical protein HGRIS_004647 [Hohenbuehelia grisea]|uniref:Lipoyl-binding domain-containing protein n=1 Tax=Hohenbuehelia grisea TaxID=104357 RepID=A0ABR3JE68_9AGAR
MCDAGHSIRFLSRHDNRSLVTTYISESLRLRKTRTMTIINVKAPVSGVVEDVKVLVGDTVSAGMLLTIQSATKTETQVPAPTAGRVKKIAKKGDDLKEGDIIAEIEY